MGERPTEVPGSVKNQFGSERNLFVSPGRNVNNKSPEGRNFNKEVFLPPVGERSSDQQIGEKLLVDQFDRNFNPVVDAIDCFNEIHQDSLNQTVEKNEKEFENMQFAGESLPSATSAAVSGKSLPSMSQRSVASPLANSQNTNISSPGISNDVDQIFVHSHSMCLHQAFVFSFVKSIFCIHSRFQV